MKKKIVIIGASELQLPLILKAKEGGYETHVFAWKCGDIGEKMADVFYPISIIEKEEILEICKEINPEGIVSIASDLAVITVNYVAEKLGLVGNPTKYTQLTTNKYEMRKKLCSENLNCPQFYVVDEKNKDRKEIRYPIIVKPTDRSGSRGVYKVENKEGLEKAIANARDQSFNKQVIVEEYVEGKEYSVEFITQDGKHDFLAITEKVTTGAPNFIEIGHIQGADLDYEIIEQVKLNVERSLNSLGIINGASHTEIIITREKKIFIIEVGARMGGDCIGSDLVYISTGIDFVSKVIDVSVGNKITIKRNNCGIGVVRYILNLEDYELLETIREKNRDVIYRESKIEDIDNRTIRDSSMRYGFYILRFKNRGDINKVFNKRK